MGDATKVYKFIDDCLAIIRGDDPAPVLSVFSVEDAKEAGAVDDAAEESLKAAEGAVADSETVANNLAIILEKIGYTKSGENIFVKTSGDLHKAIYIDVDAKKGNAWVVSKNESTEDKYKGGKKSKTHRQKKVHRSTQKRNGRKKTSNRRK